MFNNARKKFRMPGKRIVVSVSMQKILVLVSKSKQMNRRDCLMNVNK